MNMYAVRQCAVAALFLATSLLTACGTDMVSVTDLRSTIRNYLYKAENQPTTGPQFVKWAEQNLKRYSDREIERALREEGAYQAEQGHPNTVGVLSYAAQAWARAKGLQYDENYWVKLSEQAKANLRQPGKLQVWPGTTPVEPR